MSQSSSRYAAAALRGGRADSVHRDFPGRRTLVNLLRTAHIAGLVGVGAVLLGAAVQPGPFLVLLLGSGLAMGALDWWADPALPGQLNGLVLGIKVALLGLFLLLPGQRLELFWLILVVSVMIAHAPGRVRHWRWLRRGSGRQGDDEGVAGELAGRHPGRAGRPIDP